MTLVNMGGKLINKGGAIGASSGCCCNECTETYAKSGGSGVTVNDHQFPTRQLRLGFTWDAFMVPDKFTVSACGSEIFSIGPVSDKGEKCFTKPEGCGTVTVRVEGPDGTLWVYGLSCKCVDPEPEGACCFFGLGCSQVTAKTCEDNGGEYQGDGTDCDTNTRNAGNTCQCSCSYFSENDDVTIDPATGVSPCGYTLIPGPVDCNGYEWTGYAWPCTCWPYYYNQYITGCANLDPEIFAGTDNKFCSCIEVYSISQKCNVNTCLDENGICYAVFPACRVQYKYFRYRWSNDDCAWKRYSIRVETFDNNCNDDIAPDGCAGCPDYPDADAPECPEFVTHSLCCIGNPLP